MANQNLAVIPDAWEWNHGGFPQYTFVDYAVTHNGHPSLRMEADYVGQRESITYPEGRNGNWQWGFPCKPGDHIVFKVWIKTASAENPSHNGDKYYGGGRCMLVFIGGGVTVLMPLDKLSYEEVCNQYVPFGSDWTLRIWDIVVPNTWFDNDPSWYPGDPYPPPLRPITPRQIDWFAASLQIMPWTEKGVGWFADAELYINPVEEPPITYVCSICAAVFNTQADLDDHMLIAHPTPPPPAPYTSTYIAYASGVSQRDIAVLRVLGHHFLPAWVISMYDFAGGYVAKLLVNKSSKKTLARFFEWVAKRGGP